MGTRSSFIKRVLRRAAVAILWLVLARVIWVVWPYLSTNENPSLRVPCARGMFNCTLDAQRTFWNYNTDLSGLLVTHVLSALIVGLIIFVVYAYIKAHKSRREIAMSTHTP